MSLFTRTTELKRFKRGALPKVAIAVLLVIPRQFLRLEIGMANVTV